MREMPSRGRSRRGAGLLVGALLLIGAGPSLAQEGGGAATPPPVQAEPPAEPAPGEFRQSPTPGAAQSPERVREARRHFDAAVSSFQQGRLGSARVEFEEAYRLSGEPDLLINLAVVTSELDEPEDAIIYYERYLAARPNTKERDEIQQLIRRLEARVAEGRRAREARELARRPPPPPPAPRRLPAGALGLVGAGGGALVAGVALLATSAGLAGRVNSGERFDATLADRGRALAQAGVALAVIGGVGAAAGAGWLIYDRRKGPGREGARVSIAPAGAGVTLAGTF